MSKIMYVAISQRLVNQKKLNWENIFYNFLQIFFFKIQKYLLQQKMNNFFWHLDNQHLTVHQTAQQWYIQEIKNRLCRAP